MNETLIELSRLQFAVTAMYHFIFVPLTLGLTFLLAIMESVYVMTGREIYKEMTKFWGKLFGINFAIGVATGITMEFQFGMNWSYYSHYVGDIFGAPLAIEGLMAFFLESTFIGLFFFGWDRLSKVKHLMVTWLVALGSNFSALWILIANGWMQNPEGSVFNPETMRMEMQSFAELVMNPVAQVKFVHTVSAGYVTGSMFVLAISAYYLLRKRHLAFARRSFAIAASFGLASALSVIVLGDESGYELGDVQKVKLAAVEAEWETHEPPAAFTLFGLPNEETQHTDYAIRIPYVMGLIATRSLDESVIGLADLKEQHREKIYQGAQASILLEKLRREGLSEEETTQFDTVKGSLGYGLLLDAYAADLSAPTEAEVQAIMDYVASQGAEAVLSKHWADGSKGSADLARKVVEIVEAGGSQFAPLYPDEMGLFEKIETVAKRIYRADEVLADGKIRDQLRKWEEQGYGNLPVCMAKTQYSFTTDPNRRGAPTGHSLPVREVRLSAGAGFIVAICGEIMTMPGLPRVPSSEAIHLNEQGQIEGLF